MNVDAVAVLRCPVCFESLSESGGTLTCGVGHSFDVARQGYVSLLGGRAAPGSADTGDMVAARSRFMSAGHYGPVASTVGQLLSNRLSADPDVGLVDVGAGPGWLLASLIGRLSARWGIALDASKHAARRAASAHERIVAVVCDAWSQMPIADGSAAAVISFFAPRNPDEFARILRPGGVAVIITPQPDHLSELVDSVGLLTVDQRKAERLERSFGDWKSVVEIESLRFGMSLDRASVRDLILMGPSAFHAAARDLESRLEALGEPARTTAAFDVRVLTPDRSAIETPHTS